MKKYAVILAAGIGSRLYPITEIMPKSLVKVNGREIVDYQIQGYIKAGIKEEDISIVTGYRTPQFREFLLKNYPKVNIIENKDYLSTNNMYSLYMALKYIHDNKPDFDNLFINNADCLYDENMMFEFVNCEYESAIASEAGTFIDESMKIVVDKNKRIIDIAKTITKEKAYAVSIDLYKYSKNATDELYKIVCDFIEIKKDLKQWSEIAFPFLFKKVDVFPFDIKHKKWVEVDNMEDLLTADKKFSTFDYKSKKAYICDLDGTLFMGNEPITPAINFVKNNSNIFDFYFLTNNTSKTPDKYVQKLNNAGIPCKISQILTPLYPLIEYLKKYKSIYLVSNKEITSFIKENLPDINIEYDYNTNEAIVLTYDTEIDYSKMKNISVLLNNKKNIEYIATHADTFCPTEKGNIPDIGSFIELIKLTTSETPDTTFGKPSINLIKHIIEKYGEKNLAIAGDRLYTDMQLAINSNIDFITVLSGETSRFDVAKNNSCKFVYKNLGEITD